jgi:hypothetical protein
LASISQDPLAVIYDNLFFGLLVGRYDIHLITQRSEQLIEDFVIVRQIYRDKTLKIKMALKNQNNNHLKEKYDRTPDLIIHYITYSSTKNGDFIGLGVRIFPRDKTTLGVFGDSSEMRIQKTMFLLSRGLLGSLFHTIEQRDIELTI